MSCMDVSRLRRLQLGSVSLMSAAQFRQSVTIPAVPEQVREARAFVLGCSGSPESGLPGPRIMSIAVDVPTP